MGAVACLALLTLTSACGDGAVQVDTTDLGAHGHGPRLCRSLVDALPDSVSDQPRRRVEPTDAPAAAWGDPAIVLRCGVPMPAGFDEFATCQVANGVAWFVPREAIEDQDADVVMTTIGRAVDIEVVVPGRYRPPAAAMVDLAGAIKQTVPEVDPCT